MCLHHSYQVVCVLDLGLGSWSSLNVELTVELHNCVATDLQSYRAVEMQSHNPIDL